jgi:hypothetical protein
LAYLPEEALRYGQEAGIQALHDFAPHAALTQVRRAATASANLALALPARVRHARGRAQQMVGNLATAQAEFEALLAEARAISGDRNFADQVLALTSVPYETINTNGQERGDKIGDRLRGANVGGLSAASISEPFSLPCFKI